jgi:hypothetical protein
VALTLDRVTDKKVQLNTDFLKQGHRGLSKNEAFFIMEGFLIKG